MTFTRHRSRLLAVLLAAIALVASGCGSGERVVVSDPIVEPVDEAAAGEATGDGAALSPAADAADDSVVEAPEDFELNFGGAEDDDAAAGVQDDDTAEASEQPDGDPDEDASIDDRASGFDVASLKTVAATTEASTSYRFEVFLEWVMADPTFSLNLSPDTPLATGAVTGDASTYAADLGPFMAELFSELGGDDILQELFGDDLSIEVVDDGNGRLYMHAPFIASLAGDGALPSSFTALGSGWGVVDLSRLSGVGAAELAGLTGAQGGSSPDAVLDLLYDAGTVSELGRADVRGVPTDHLRVGVTFAQLVDAQGADLGDLEAFAGDIDRLLDVEFPFDLFVDDEGRVRRVMLTIDLDALEELIGEAAPTGTTFSMTTVMDFFDYDDPSIAVTPPADADIVVDLTDDLAALFG